MQEFIPDIPKYLQTLSVQINQELKAGKASVVDGEICSKPFGHDT